MKRRAFTLPELLIVIMIIGIMAGLALSAVGGAIEMAREARTRSMIARIDGMIAEKYEGYRTRAVPIRLPVNTPPQLAGRLRLYALRDLMRMEMPERITDVIDNPATLNASPLIVLPVPQNIQHYRRMAFRKLGATWAADWSVQHQGAECLYLIVENMSDGDKRALDYFQEGEIGDTDGDKMLEILDAWGRPIEFLRWAGGYNTQAGNPTTVNTTHPDPFDPAKADNRATFALRPLIFSGGRDKLYDVETNVAIRYSLLAPVNDPYYMGANGMNGATHDANQDGDLSFADNITNHYQETP